MLSCLYYWIIIYYKYHYFVYVRDMSSQRNQCYYHVWFLHLDSPSLHTVQAELIMALASSNGGSWSTALLPMSTPSCDWNIPCSNNETTGGQSRRIAAPQDSRQKIPRSSQRSLDIRFSNTTWGNLQATLLLLWHQSFRVVVSTMVDMHALKSKHYIYNLIIFYLFIEFGLDRLRI